jgi:hypothetical protein
MIHGASYDYFSGDVTLLYDGEPMTFSEVQKAMQDHLSEVGVGADPELLRHSLPNEENSGAIVFTWKSFPRGLTKS